MADAYRAAGLEPPTIFIWLDSPMAGAIGASILTGTAAPAHAPAAQDQAWAQVREQIETQAPARIRGRLGTEAGDQVRDQVRDQLWSEFEARARREIRARIEDELWHRIHERLHGQKVRDEVGGRVWTQIREQLGAHVHRSVGGQHDAERLAEFDYFRAHCSITEADRLVGVMRVARSAGRWWPFENAVILTERPTVLHRDGQGRLHCETGPAIAYPDGFAVWAWHGVRLPPDPVTTRPTIDRTDHDSEAEAVVVRTDHSDDKAWRAVVDLLNQPDGEFEVRTHLVDDRAFAGASPDEVVLSALAGQPRLEVVFLADAATMRGEHTLLAVATGSQLDDVDEEEEEDEVELRAEFRLLPTLVNLMHVNLAIGHSDFWSFAYAAADDPDYVYRE
ncbi:hypothetical protein OG533_24205 [Streptomyces sp. NBC_01186]|uniref:DUF6924 domain-containing protein n=1 Tax=Streptomyces sp. NBC_01186 TaxID=2903765 RepID=UPI002E165D61|nr:hypothetical protein OG533_24205 [Streptomyces sp. NBC_01186]